MKQSHLSQQVIDSIATEVVLLDPKDPRACTRLYDMLRDLGARSSATDKIRRLADEAAAVAWKLIFKEYDPPERGTGELERLVSQMQTLEASSDSESKMRARSTQTSESTSSGEQYSQLLEEFISKQTPLLTRFEEKLNALTRGDPQASPELLRMIHSRAEETAVLGQTAVAAYLQEVEAKAAEWKTKDTSEYVALLRGAKEHLEKALMEISSRGAAVSPLAPPRPVDDLKESQSSAATQVKEEERFAFPSDIDATLVTEFREEALEHIQNAEVALLNLETNPDDKESVNVVFRAFHTIKGVASFLGLEYLTDLAHNAETFLDRARKGRLILADAYADLAFEALDGLKFLIQDLQESMARGYAKPCPDYAYLCQALEHPEEMAQHRRVETQQERPRLGDILVESGAVSLKAVEEAVNEQVKGEERPLGEILVRKGSAAAKDVAKALQAQKNQATSAGMMLQETEGAVKVGTTRLDALINMVGELVIAQAMVSQDEIIRSSKNHHLNRKVGHLAKITRMLQELALLMRMVSVKPTFQKMARLVRDLARKSNKEVTLTLEGEDTELDRNMVEAIADPLVHLIRNAVDHGIESPEERRKLGKPTAGQLVLRAKHEGSGMVITLQDDGQGLDIEKIRKKAIEKGLISADAVLSETEIYRLIFQPGFSTAELVTDVSGRGVGMDVVRSPCTGAFSSIPSSIFL